MQKLLPIIFFQQTYDKQLTLACDVGLPIGFCHCGGFKNRLLHFKISTVDIFLIGEIVGHKDTHSSENGLQSVSADGGAFGSRKLCHFVHIDEIIGV